VGRYSSGVTTGGFDINNHRSTSRPATRSRLQTPHFQTLTRQNSKSPVNLFDFIEEHGVVLRRNLPTTISGIRITSLSCIHLFKFLLVISWILPCLLLCYTTTPSGAGIGAIRPHHVSKSAFPPLGKTRLSSQ